MSNVPRQGRAWWQRPRRAADRPKERRVTFLELFYDLVYVVLISEIAHSLSAHVDFHGLAVYCALFAVVWWAWLNGTMYHDTHGNDDLRTRLFTFLQMFAVASMALFAHRAVGEGSVGFALSYAAFQLVLTILWWRTGVHDRDHRPLSLPYSLVFLASTVLFAVSIRVPVPQRYTFWIIGLGITLLLPLLMLLIGKLNKDARAQLEQTFSISPSAAERFGLFTIIVLGEVIVGVVRGLAGHHHLTGIAAATGALGMAIAIGIWWVYFDFASLQNPKRRRGTVILWIYLHLPMTLSIGAIGAAVLNIVEASDTEVTTGAQWLLSGATASALLCIAGIMLSLDVEESHKKFRRVGAFVSLAGVVATLAVGYVVRGRVPMMGATAAILIAPVGAGFAVWVRRLKKE